MQPWITSHHTILHILHSVHVWSVGHILGEAVNTYNLLPEYLIRHARMLYISFLSVIYCLLLFICFIINDLMFGINFFSWLTYLCGCLLYEFLRI